MSTRISTSSSSATIAASIGTSRSRRCSDSRHTMSRRATGTSLVAPIPARATSRSGVSRGVEKQPPECAKTARPTPKSRAKIRLRTRGVARCGRTWDNAISLFWILAAVILVLVIILLVLAATDNISATQVLISLGLVVALLFLLPRVPDVVRVVVGKGGLTVELEQAKKDAAEAMTTAAEAS